MAVGYIPLQWAKPEHPSQAIPNLDALIQSAAQKYGVDPNFIADIIWHESGGLNIPTRIKPPPGKVYTAYGPMQTIAAHYANPEDRKDPIKNIDTGTAYFARLLKRYNGNPYDAIRAYAVGEGNVDKWIKNGRSLTGLGSGVTSTWSTGDEMVRYLQGRVASREGTGISYPTASPVQQPQLQQNAGTYYAEPVKTPTSIPFFTNAENALMQQTWNSYVKPYMPENVQNMFTTIQSSPMGWGLGYTTNGYNNGW